MKANLPIKSMWGHSLACILYNYNVQAWNFVLDVAFYILRAQIFFLLKKLLLFVTWKIGLKLQVMLCENSGG